MKAVLEARLRYSAMQIEADRTVAEQSMKNLGLRLDFSKFGADFALKYRTEAINGMNGLIQAYAALNRGEMEYYAAIAQAQRTNLEALIGYYRLSLSEAEMGMKVSTENISHQAQMGDHRRSIHCTMRGASRTGSIRYGFDVRTSCWHVARRV
jgi:hypothetical protein